MQSDRLNTNLTEIQIEGIRLHDLNRTKLVNIVNEKYKAKQRKKDLRNSKEGQKSEAKKQTR
jgi:hypothetical protein